MKLHQSTYKFFVTLSLALSLSGIVAPANLWAQEATEEKKAQASKFYEEGAAAFFGKKYGAAILAYNKGYAIYPNGAFLVQLARAHGKLKEYSEARKFAYRAENDPSTPERLRSANLERLAEFTALDSQDAAKRIAGFVKQSQPVGGGSEGDGGIGPFGWTGLILGAAGVGTLASSLYFNGQVSEYKSGDSDLTPEEAQSAQTTGRILLGVGTAVTVIGFGMFLYALGTSSSDSDSAMFFAEPLDGGAYAGTVWRW